MAKPRMSDCALYGLLRMGEIAEFNRRRANGEACDLVGVELSRLDLRGMLAEGLDLNTAVRGALVVQAIRGAVAFGRGLSRLRSSNLDDNLAGIDGATASPFRWISRSTFHN